MAFIMRMMTAQPLRGVGPFGRVVFAFAEHTTPGERARALPSRLACELFDVWCPPHRSVGGANATIIESAVSLGGRLGEDAAALRWRVREALRQGRLRASREERGAVATAAQRHESTEALEPLVEEKLEDIGIVTVEDRTWRRLSGIRLTIAPGNGGPTTKNTDEEGAVELRGVRPGMCRVSAAFEGVMLDAGEAPSATDKGDNVENDERRFALVLGRYKVATGESLASVAEANGMTWQPPVKILYEPSRPLAAAAPELPSELVDVVMRAVQPNLARRYPTMQVSLDTVRANAASAGENLTLAEYAPPPPRSTHAAPARTTSNNFGVL